jgi:hypothetical protein
MVGRRRSVGSRREFDGCIFQQVRSRFPSRYLVGLRIAGTRSGVRYSGASYQDPSDGAPTPSASRWAAVQSPLSTGRGCRARVVGVGGVRVRWDVVSWIGSRSRPPDSRSRLGLARRRSVDRPACGLWPTLGSARPLRLGRLGQGPVRARCDQPADTGEKHIGPTGPGLRPRGIAGELRWDGLLDDQVRFLVSRSADTLSTA